MDQHKLTHEQLAQWDQDGFVVLRGFFDAEKLSRLKPPSNNDISSERSERSKCMQLVICQHSFALD